jgi:glycosyltransferase involved in cell wall biosynthesis
MELWFDLRWDQSSAPADPRRRTLGFSDLTVAAGSPRGLVELLWGTRYEALVIVEDDLPKSAKQAAALLVGSTVRARRRRISRPSGPVELRWSRFVVRALAEVAVAAPRELWRSWAMRRRAGRIATRRLGLPRLASETGSVLYLRAEPWLMRRGAFVGGAATHTAGVVNALVANGLDTRVYACQEPPGLAAPVTRVSPRRLYHFEPWLTLVDLSEAFVVATEHESADFVYQRYALGSYAGLEIARRLDVPLVLEYNGSETWIARHWARKDLSKRGDRLRGRFERSAVREASLNVVAAEPLREELIAWDVDPDRILVNPNGVDVDRLAPLRDRASEEWRAIHQLPDAPTVGFVGTFGPWHGVQLLPEMIDRVRDLVPEARWVIVGDGLLFGEVSDAIRARGLTDRVFLPGSVPHAVALELLAASDVCVSPHVPNPDGSRFFGSPTKLFEYMGLGKPIVAGDLEQIGEVIDDGRTGLLFKPGRVEDAAKAVGDLLSDGGRRTSLGSAALEEARRHYTWDAHVQRILEALHR